ncbi:RHS repeat-associated core domain-containing protein [Nonomuraea rhodomycinica]|uniref:Type IV secretion protein Rhs n=1 Tax=Nonomuraea rhodomycinica TaxID=1712872 RepID=A0A7Y6IKI9_9ACTN|nr:RHS repeat-associated core domain-containing protein [Nonomuraea rhodomycinica]NUW39836.1 type IV secretion protein Rhs [Nonomuraea rhodomycinica]
MDAPSELDLPETHWNRFQQPARPSPWPRRLATVLAVVMIAPLAYAMPASAAPRSAPVVRNESPVRGRPVPVLPRTVDQAEKQAWKAPPGVTWPKPQAVELDTTGRTRTLAAGFPVRATTPKTAAKTTGEPRTAAQETAGEPKTAAQETAAPKADAAPERVRVELLDTAKTGMLGLAMRVTPGQGIAARSGRTRLEIDYSGFRYASGGDYASRLRLVKLQDCALAPTTGGAATGACPLPEPVPSENDTKAGTISADLDLPALYAVTAAASGPAGDHSATSLAPSAEWSVGAQSGDFGWSYELRAPPALGGDEPEMTVAYSAQSVDGRTASTNNQPSWVGEGFELNPGGFIERQYKSCMLDGKKTGDLCWDGENVTLSLGGSAVELIKDATTKQWRPKRDDGTRVEYLKGAVNGDNDGEYWRVTTADGTQYTFGLNRLPGWVSGKPETKSVQTVPVFGNNSGEPCYNSTPADAWCQQAYRWNLDLSVDTHGNAITYWYETEKNYYGRNMKPELGTVYTRGGYLTRIDYGYLQGELFTRSPAARVVFDVAERCVPGGTVTCAADQFTKENASHWPDVPFDQVCDAGVKCTDRLAPTFFTRKRLAKVTTQIVNATGGYNPVDSWTLTHQFPASGDGMSPALWLASIQQTGHVGGTVTLPKVTFTGVQLPNRVDADEGRAPLVKWRVQTVNNENGGELRVSYSAADCKPGDVPAADKNTRLCFPQRWAPPNEGEVTDWFHKYVVTQTVEVDRVAGSPWVVTDYEYLDGAAWHFTDSNLVKPAHRTWSDWRGFGRVRVRQGDGKDVKRTLTEFRYFRGMDGDKLADGSKRDVQVVDSEGGKIDDLDQYAGLEREEILHDGDGGPIVTATTEEPWSLKTAESTQGGVTKAAYIVEPKSMVTRTALEGGKWRRTGETRAYDEHGLLTQVEEQNDLATTDDDQCVRYTYARNSTAWMLDYESRIQKVAAGCGTAVSTLAAGDIISDERVQYDSRPYGQGPVKGDITTIQEVVSGDGTTVTNSVLTYDAYGRTTSETDAVGTTVKTTYTPASGAPATEVKETNPLGHEERTLLEPAWGRPVAEIDANGKRVDMEYDALGRLVKVWQSDRSKAAGQSPSTEYSYLTRPDGPSVVTTKTLRADGGYTTSHELYDGLLRERQTQEPAPRDDQTQDPALRDGRTVTDTFYNSLGEVARSNGGYFSPGAPSTDLLAVADTDVPSQLGYVYDGTGEVTAQVLRAKGVEKWRATATTQGDRVHITPPPGGTATTRIGDADDRLIELRQYEGATPTGEYDATKYTYDAAGRLATVTDPAGNVWRHHYDLRGREIKTEDPDKGVTTFTYNDADELLTSTDARGKTLAYVYDELGRKKELREGSKDGPLLASWEYDKLAKGHQNAAIRYVGGQAYKAEINAIDSDYRALRETVTIPEREGKLAGTYVLNTRYTLDDEVQSVSFPAGGGLADEQVVYDYDELGQPTKVTGLSSYVTAARYSKLGEVLQYELSTGGRKSWLTYTHDEVTQRLTRTRLDRESEPAADLDLNYTYDPAGNLTKISDKGARGPDTQCFTYDHLRRLTSAWTATDDCASGSPQPDKIGGVAPYATSYAYDVTGNRTKETQHAFGGRQESVRTFTYPKAGEKQPHALQTVGADVFEYDPTGNTTRRKVGTSDQTLTWDAEGNLESVTEAGKTTSFVYDADGDRLIRRTPTDTTLYIDDMELRLDTAKDVVEQTRYYTINGEPVAVRTPDNQVYFLAGDHQGTALAAVNAGSGDLAVRRLTPFGEDRGSPPEWWPGQRGFVGGVKDQSIGLVQLGAREYDARNGRFLSVDPVIDEEDPQQLNAYAYANNSPVTMSDADGQWVWIIVAVVGRFAARQLAKKLAQQAARREAIRLARQRAIARAKALAREQARKRALAKAKKEAEQKAKRKAKELARRKKAEEAKKKAEEARKKAAEAARKRRAAKAKRQAKQAARRTLRHVKKKTGGRVTRLPRYERQRPGRRPTSHRAGQRQSPPKSARSRAARPGQVYGNNGVAQPTQSVTVFRNGKMYPDGAPPPNLTGPSGSGQGLRQDYKPQELEPPETRTGTISDAGFRMIRYFDQSGLDDFFGGLF